MHGPFLCFAAFREVRKASEESDDEWSDMPATHSPIELEAVVSRSSESSEEEARERNRQVPRASNSSGRDDEDVLDTKLAHKSRGISNKKLLVILLGVVVHRKEFRRDSAVVHSCLATSS